MVDLIEMEVKMVKKKDDSRLGMLENIFVVPLSAKEQSVQDAKTSLCILFTDSAFFREGKKEFDHIVDAKSTLTDPMLTPHIQKIKEYLSDTLIKNPRQENYQALYAMISSHPTLQDILSNNRIQDRAHFDETIYTEPVETISTHTDQQIAAIETIAKEWEEKNAIYRAQLGKENTVRLDINMTKRLLDNNKSLVGDSTVQERQRLHKTYQQTLAEIAVLSQRIEKYNTDLNYTETTIQVIQSKIASLEDTYANNKNPGKLNKVKKKMTKQFPDGIAQGIIVIGELTRQCIGYENMLCTLGEELTIKQNVLQALEEELINIFPPAKAMFALVKTEEEQLSQDKKEKELASIDSEEKIQDYQERQEVKKTFEFLYKEEKLINNLMHRRVQKNTIQLVRDIVLQESLGEDELVLYKNILKELTERSREKSNRNTDEQKIYEIQGRIAHIANTLLVSHNERFVGHSRSCPQLAGHFAAIQQYEMQISHYQDLIGQEKKDKGLNRNQSNEKTSEYGSIILNQKKSIKEHGKEISLYIKGAYTSLEHAKNKESLLDTTISQRKTSIVSTQQSIRDLLANPNHLIVIKDIPTLHKELDDYETILTTIQFHVNEHKGEVFNTTNSWYQSILPLDTLIDAIDKNYTTLKEMETILDDYLPRPGYKMSDTDRDIRRKRDDLHDSRLKAYQLGEKIQIIVDDSVQINNDLARNKEIKRIHKKITDFMDTAHADMH